MRILAYALAGRRYRGSLNTMSGNMRIALDDRGTCMNNQAHLGF